MTDEQPPPELPVPPADVVPRTGRPSRDVARALVEQSGRRMDMVRTELTELPDTLDDVGEPTGVTLRRETLPVHTTPELLGYTHDELYGDDDDRDD